MLHHAADDHGHPHGVDALLREHAVDAVAGIFGVATERDAETAASKLPSLLTAGAVAMIPTGTTVERSHMFALAEGLHSVSAPGVPAFLRNEQFRI